MIITGAERSTTVVVIRKVAVTVMERDLLVLGALIATKPSLCPSVLGMNSSLMTDYLCLWRERRSKGKKGLCKVQVLI